MPSFGLQNMAFRAPKGGLLACKRWPLTNRPYPIRTANPVEVRFIASAQQNAWPFTGDAIKSVSTANLCPLDGLALFIRRHKAMPYIAVHIIKNVKNRRIVK